MPEPFSKGEKADIAGIIAGFLAAAAIVALLTYLVIETLVNE